MLESQEIETRFTYHPPVDDQTLKYESIRETLKQAAYLLNNMCPDSRELSLAFTHLEQVGFYANASIARR